MPEINVNDLKGYIQCPCCKNKTMVEKGAKGRVIQKCSCSRFILFDYENMTARQCQSIKGATAYFNRIGNRLS